MKGSRFTERQSQRLLAAIYPTRVEKILEWLKMRVWSVFPDGHIGGWLDDLEIWLRNRRVEGGKYDAGFRR